MSALQVKSEELELDLQEQYGPSLFTDEEDQLQDESFTSQGLRQHTTYQRTIQELFDDINHGNLFWDQDYQRDVVWKPEKQSFLVDSILWNYPIFPIILANARGRTRKNVIDGKQRLTAIFKFLTGEIPHQNPKANDTKGHKRWFRVANGNAAKRQKLPDELCRSFLEKKLVVYEFENISDAEERAIFERIQCGVALTNDEILQVINSPRTDFVRYLADHYLTEDKLAHSDLKWERKRGKAFRILGQAVYTIDKWDTPLSFGKGDYLMNWFRETNNGKDQNTANGKGKQRAIHNDDDDEDEYMPRQDQEQLQQPINGPEVPQQFRDDVLNAFDILIALLKDQQLKQPFMPSAFPTKKLSPVEMIHIIVLVFILGVRGKDNKILTPAQLSRAVYKLREYANDTKIFPERKNRTDINLKMIEFIKGYSLGEEENPPLQTAAAIAATPPFALGQIHDNRPSSTSATGNITRSREAADNAAVTSSITVTVPYPTQQFLVSSSSPVSLSVGALQVQRRVESSSIQPAFTGVAESTRTQAQSFPSTIQPAPSMNTQRPGLFQMKQNGIGVAKVTATSESQAQSTPRPASTSSASEVKTEPADPKVGLTTSVSGFSRLASMDKPQTTKPATTPSVKTEPVIPKIITRPNPPPNSDSTDSVQVIPAIFASTHISSPNPASTTSKPLSSSISRPTIKRPHPIDSSPSSSTPKPTKKRKTTARPFGIPPKKKSNLNQTGNVRESNVDGIAKPRPSSSTCVGASGNTWTEAIYISD